MLGIYQQPREALGWQKVRKKVSVRMSGSRAQYQIHTERNRDANRIIFVSLFNHASTRKPPVSQSELIGTMICLSQLQDYIQHVLL